ncbi:MAG: hypothetical protein AB7O43_19725 [Hyphomicrobiaceae bacterium]
MTRDIFIALAAGMMLSAASPALADMYTVDCNQAGQDWAKCVIDRSGTRDPKAGSID